MLTLIEILGNVRFEDLLYTLSVNAKQINGKFIYSIDTYNLGTRLSIRCLDNARQGKELLILDVVKKETK